MKVKYSLKELALFHETCMDYLEDVLTNDGREMFNEIGLILFSLEERHGSRIATERKTQRT